MSAHSQVTVYGGNFQDPSGTPLAGGTITFRLSTDAVSNRSQVVAGRLVSAVLDTYGNISGTVMLWSNDANSGLLPLNSVYFINVYNAAGLRAWSAQGVIPSTSSTFDIGALVPLY